jgi:iron complex outermembrane receptor protein
MPLNTRMTLHHGVVSRLVPVITLALALVGVQTAHAQAPVPLTGTVTDASGGALQGATVEAAATDAGTGRVVVAITDADGSYRLQLPPGGYRVRVTLNGFADATAEVRITAATPATHDATLAIAGFTENTVVVTATRSERPLRDVPATLNVVTQDEIATKGMRYIGDELQSVPGVFVQKNDEGAYTSMTIRGVPEQHHNETFLALLDGVPFVSGNDEIQLESIPADIVDRVEVVKGPMSALYGRGSVAGAVNYISRPVPLTQAGLASASFGSYAYARPAVSNGWSTNGGRSHTFLSSYGETKGGWRDNTERSAANVFAKNQTFLSQKTDLVVYGNVHDYRQNVGSHIPMRDDGSLVDVIGGRRANYNIQDSYYDSSIFMGSAVLRHTPNDRWTVRTVVHGRYLDSSSNLGFNEGFDEESASIQWNGFKGLSTQRVFFVEPQVTYTGSRLRVVAGGSFERVDGTSQEFWTGQYGFSFTDFNFYFYSQKRSYETGEFLNRDEWITDPLLDAEYSANIAAGYVQAEANLGSRVTLTAGVRADRFARAVDYLPYTTAEGPQAASTVDDSDAHLSPKAALSVKLTDHVTAYGAFGEGFSPAFGPIWAFGGRNVNLKPELARSLEGGLKGDLLGGRLSFGAAAYRITRRDLLQLVLDGPGTRTTNAGRQESQGVELDTRLTLRRGDRATQAYARYAYTDSLWKDNQIVLDFTNEVIDLTGKAPTRVPAHQLSVGLTQQMSERLSSTIWYDYAGEYFIDGINSTTAPGVGQLNASLTARLTRRIEAQMTATNLTNKTFYYYWGTSRGPSEAYPAQPFQLLGALRVRF